MPSLPEVNIEQLVAQSESQPGEDPLVALSENALKRNRRRILELLREVAMINALPAACAGSASFASQDVREVFDFLYEAGYNTQDIFYFDSQFGEVFRDHYRLTKETINRSGYDEVCRGDMVGETRKAFEKMEQIRSLFR